MLRSKFDKLRMKDGETIFDFNVRLIDMVNEVDAMNSPYEEKELVDEVMRHVTPKFHMKVATPGELQDTTDMKLDALMRSLQTYEMKFEEEVTDKLIKQWDWQPS